MINISSAGTTAGYFTDKNIGNGAERTIQKTQSTIDEKSGNPSMSEERRQQLVSNIENVIQAIQSTDTQIKRSVHEGTNQIVYKVVNKESGEVIKQIPEEKLLDIATKIMELTGIIVDEKA
ncbi:flagellar protein FlaG [Paenibacillus chungangensis]|uniref:Flagellar protein FlaG n=1 Tax=Paenibacillus chungangensis TaxID=696535 RepID=A0ABW3HWN9_9BACL